MKKICVVLLAFFLLISAAACSDDQGKNDQINTEQSETVQDDDDQPVGGGIQTAEVLFDFSNGSPEENVRRETHYSYSDVTGEEITDAMSGMSGLDFFVRVSVVENRYVADWAANSTLIAGLDDREQKEDFFFYDADSMRWFMMDSLWRTLKELYAAEDIYYTMDGGKELAFDELYATRVFPADAPYMGSAFYFAHSDVIGDFSYIDEEYNLILYYPGVFAQDGEPDENGVIIEFPSRQDNTVLQYWVISNTYGDTTDSFAESAPAGEISIYENVVTGWGYSLDQLTGVETPNAYYWVVEQDWIACVAISCETQEQAVEWYRMIKEENAVSIDGFFGLGEGESGISEEEAMDILSGALDMTEGTALVSYGEEIINGVHCWTFAYGMNTPEKFTAEIQYAVTDYGVILVYSFADNEYREL